MAGQRVVVVDAENRDPPQVGLPDGVRGGVEKGERLRRVDVRVDAACGNVLALDLAVLDELAKPLHSVDSSARLLAFPVAVLALVRPVEARLELPSDGGIRSDGQCSSYLTMTWPPSTTRVWPVTFRASSETRKMTAFAMSSGSISRREARATCSRE
jgi:hypothetical protein